VAGGDPIIDECGHAVQAISVMQLRQLEQKFRQLLGLRQMIARERIDMCRPDHGASSLRS
jgi:hypothetical protein